ncbi:MAG TPA: RNA polymerase sigma-54 factor, partial [Bacteroidales bacterium]|nr:RNA polymerase sigma-54 factor [Bacteroidales bacterium]
MLKQKLSQKLLQKLSPQQIQMIKLLEIPTVQLEQRIKKEIEENPALDEGNDDDENDTDSTDDNSQNDNEQDEFSLDDYLEDEDIPEYRLQTRNYSKGDDKKQEIPFSTGTSFHEFLHSQIRLRDLDEKQEVLADYILGNIDEDGYLRREIENIVDDLAFSQNINTTEEELSVVLEIVQDLEPAGVGAHDLRECLLLQINRKDNENVAVQRATDMLAKY